MEVYIHVSQHLRRRFPLRCIYNMYLYSLWSRDIEKDIVPTCRELGLQIVAYSPLGKMMLILFVTYLRKVTN